MIDGFLLGIIVTCSLIAAVFFYRFWRRTRDPLFACFAAAFAIEGCNRISFLFLDPTRTDNAGTYAVRVVSFLLILAAIAYKNRSNRYK